MRQPDNLPAFCRVHRSGPLTGTGVRPSHGSDLSCRTQHLPRCRGHCCRVRHRPAYRSRSGRRDPRRARAGSTATSVDSCRPVGEYSTEVPQPARIWTDWSGGWLGRGPSRSPDAIVLTAALTRSTAVTPRPALVSAARSRAGALRHRLRRTPAGRRSAGARRTPDRQPRPCAG
jgi:hypothetical protein